MSIPSWQLVSAHIAWREPISEAISGMLDIGMSSRELRENEKEALTDIAVALDGVAIIVNSANPLTGLTLEQVKDIFTGETTRWSQVN